MGGSVGKFAINVAKTASKGATSAVLGGIPIFGGILANAINGLYAEGTTNVSAINEKVKEIAPDDAKFKVISTPEALKSMIALYPSEAHKAGLTDAKIDKVVAKMAKGGQVKTKKPRTAKQIEATKKLVALNKEKRMKKYGTGCSSLAGKKEEPVAPARPAGMSKKLVKQQSKLIVAGSGKGLTAEEGMRYTSAVLHARGHQRDSSGRSRRTPDAIGASLIDSSLARRK